MITIGIDPHKRSLTAAALDSPSRLLGQLRLPATTQTASQLLAWAAAWPQSSSGCSAIAATTWSPNAPAS